MTYIGFANEDDYHTSHALRRMLERETDYYKRKVIRAQFRDIAARARKAAA